MALKQYPPPPGGARLCGLPCLLVKRPLLYPFHTLGGQLGRSSHLWRSRRFRGRDALGQPGDAVVAAAYLLAVRLLAAVERLASLHELSPQERLLVLEPLQELDGVGANCAPNLGPL